MNWQMSLTSIAVAASLCVSSSALAAEVGSFKPVRMLCSVEGQTTLFHPKLADHPSKFSWKEEATYEFSEPAHVFDSTNSHREFAYTVNSEGTIVISWGLETSRYSYGVEISREGKLRGTLRYSFEDGGLREAHYSGDCKSEAMLADPSPVVSPQACGDACQQFRKGDRLHCVVKGAKSPPKWTQEAVVHVEFEGPDFGWLRERMTIRPFRLVQSAEHALAFTWLAPTIQNGPLLMTLDTRSLTIGGTRERSIFSPPDITGTCTSSALTNEPLDDFRYLTLSNVL